MDEDGWDRRMAGGVALRPWAGAERLRWSAAGSSGLWREGKIEILVRWVPTITQFRVGRSVQSAGGGDPSQHGIT